MVKFHERMLLRPSTHVSVPGGAANLLFMTLHYMALLLAGQRCWVGNGLGKLQALDLRQRRMEGALKGFTGSVTALAAHDSQPLLAAVGLDRFLRLYDTNSRRLLARLFLTQALTGVAFCPTSPHAPDSIVPAAGIQQTRSAGDDVGPQLQPATKKQRLRKM